MKTLSFVLVALSALFSLDQAYEAGYHHAEALAFAVGFMTPNALLAAAGAALLGLAFRSMTPVLPAFGAAFMVLVAVAGIS